ncbi:MAG: pitrilysin family protein [Polyangiales bacterium]
MRFRFAREALLLLIVSAAHLGLAAPPLAPTPTPDSAKGVAPKPTTMPEDTARDAFLRPKLAISRFTLSNGLRVVLNPDPTSPTLAVVVWYDVGSRNEKPGEGGFAHLFEHLMFEGSEKVPRGVHDKIVEGRGGKNNAQTSEDFTRYYETMPSSELPVTLYLEADRMRSLNVTEEAFENQRKVVEEEYRMRVDNAPYVKGQLRLMELAYEGYHPYAHPAIGSMAELDAAKLEWVRAFHHNYYGPNNAVLVVAGDFDPKEGEKLVHQYFDAVPKIAVKPYDDAPFAGRSQPAKPEAVSDAFASTEETMLAWPIPKSVDKDHYALQIAATVLSDGESSRLERKLVKELAIAQMVSADTDDHRGPDTFTIAARLAKRGTVEDVEKRLWAEIDALAAKGPSKEELQKARAKIEHGFLFGLESNLSRALTLAKFEGERGDARLLDSEMDRLLGVSADDVRAAVAKYLKRDRVVQVRVAPANAPSKGSSKTDLPAKSEKGSAK